MAWTVYRWNDDGAPVLSAAGNSLLEVLRACLCYGYGSKIAAGWTETPGVNSESSFKNAGTGHSILVKHNTASSNATVVGVEYDAMAVFFPTTAQMPNGLYWQVSSTTDSTPRPWLVFADDRRFYLWVGASMTAEQGTASTAGMPMFFAGDIDSMNPADPHCFLVIGATSPGTSTLHFGTLSASAASPTTGHYMARSSLFSGGSIGCAKTCDVSLMGGAFVMGGSGGAYPAFGGGMLLSPVNVMEQANILRGRMPKLWNPLHALPGSPGDTFSGTGDLAGKSFILLDVASGSTRARIAMETT